MTTVDKPLRLGELLAETIRVYGERLWPSLGIGLLAALGFVIAFAVPDVAAIVIIAATFTACYAAATRLVAGDRFAESLAQVVLRGTVLVVLTLVVAVPFALGIFARAGDPLARLIFLLFAVAWLVFVGFSIPASMTERLEAPSWFSRLGHALQRSVELARAEFFHAVGITAALVLIYGLLGPLLASLLVGFGENGRDVAFVLSQIVLAPFFFLGLAVLYFEQSARALSSLGRS
ncbi:MAG: hypothetical protein H0V20_06870 [Actinobacteria bacterium]|nr:hypothetical protein [Actinomycetota bacterium]